MPRGALLAVFLTACGRPPPAPEGLDASIKHLLRGFYASDADIGAGLTGLLDWFDREGGELLGKQADVDNVGAFSLSPLTEEDVAQLDLGGADPGKATGVVSVAEMGCRWEEAEALLVRPDQDRVFDKDFDSYARSYLSPRRTYEDASRARAFDPIDGALEPDALGAVPGSVLLTENEASASSLGVTIPFDLVLRFRHGTYEVQGAEADAFLILGYLPHRAESEGGANALEQNTSIDVNVGRGRRTLRVFGNWNEVITPFFDSDSAVVAATAVNKAQDSAERLDAICTGEVALR